jgi:hypothetical protein
MQTGGIETPITVTFRLNVAGLSTVSPSPASRHHLTP